MKTFLTLAVILTLLASCAGQAQPQRYYTLDLGPAAAQSAAGTPVLSVGPVTLPEAVDRPELVMRTGANRVTLMENDRWAEPLKLQLARALAARLGQLLPQVQAISHRSNAAGSARWRLSVDVQRFESLPGQSVVMDIVWTLLPQQAGNDKPRSGRVLAEEAVAGTGMDAVVAAHDRALARVAETLAAEWKKAAALP